jgi:gliding motility-associated-like protein
VTVTDWQGCQANDSSYILEPPTFTSNVVVSNILCNGDNNGSADLTVSGGNTESEYIYLWTTINGDGHIPESEDQTDLYQGDYFVLITDAKGCELYDTAIITEPDLLDPNLSYTNVTCFGYDDGTAIVDITGGTGTYTILWSNGATNDTITGLSADTYDVNITDENGCVASDFIDILEPEKINTNISSQNITCFGLNNGEIIITPDGGTIPYSYLWSHSPTYSDSIAVNLDPGNYSISVIDNNSCIEVTSIDITQPDQLELSYSKEDITCFGLGDGYISLSMFGGTPDYTYLWSDGNIESSANMLTSGSYNIIISDLLDCQIDTTIEIIEPQQLQIFPALRKPTCSDIEDGQIELNISGGRTPYNIYWNDGSDQENLYDIRSGIYKVLINDSSFCEVDTTFTLRSAFETCINIPSAFSPNGDNINDKWVIDMNSLYPQAEIEIFDRIGKRIFFSKGYEESQYWDGTFNGKNLPMDAYYYIINLKNGTGRISGIITLLR